MTRNTAGMIVVATALLALPGQPAVPAEAVPPPAAAKAIGEVSFPISCGPAAQKIFNQAVWTLHSFWYPEAVKAFTAVPETEPSC